MDSDFTILYKKYKNCIFSYVYYLCGDRGVAEEICQDVFLKVYLNISKFEGRASFKSWIYTIAKNTHLDFVRNKNANTIQIDQEALGNKLIDNKMGPEDYLLNMEIKSLIIKTLKLMSEKQRTYLILRDLQQLSYKEISEITNEGLNTVKVGIYRARQEFRQIYQRLEEE